MYGNNVLRKEPCVLRICKPWLYNIETNPTPGQNYFSPPSVFQWKRIVRGLMLLHSFLRAYVKVIRVGMLVFWTFVNAGLNGLVSYHSDIYRVIKRVLSYWRLRTTGITSVP